MADYDPGAYTVAEVQEYVTANPDQTQAVRDAEAAGKNRSTLIAWLDEPWPEASATEEAEPRVPVETVAGAVYTDGGRVVVDSGGRPVVGDGVPDGG